MRTLTFLLLLVCMSVMVNAENIYHRKDTLDSRNRWLLSFIDTSRHNVLDIFPGEHLHNKGYIIVISKDRFDSLGQRVTEEDYWYLGCMFYLFSADHRLLHKQRIGENCWVKMSAMKQPEKILMEATGFYGGSGGGGYVYSIEPDSVKILKPLFIQGEFTRWYPRNGYIIRLHADWGQDEGHYAPHKLDLSIFRFMPNGYLKETVLGRSKYRYGYTADESSSTDWLEDMKMREPALLHKLHLW